MELKDKKGNTGKKGLHTMNMEKQGNRKEWVKNAAIIFLSIMLVLTFFSNTIMNYSLPEVATAIVEPGSITAKIRGTGTLTSEDPYKISIEESRVISSVAVKAGDTVEKDQILFYLEDKESEELEKVQEELLTEEKTLDELILAFSTKILEGTITNQSYQNIQNGNISSNNEYQARITAAKQKVENAQSTVDSLTRQEKITGTVSSSTEDKKGQLEKARLELETAIKNLGNQTEELNKAENEAKQDVSELMAKKHDAQSELTSLKTSFTTARDELSVAMKAITSDISLGTVPIIKEFEEIKNIHSFLAELNVFYEQAQNENSSDGSNLKGTLDSKLENVAKEFSEFRKIYEETLAATIDYNNSTEKVDTALVASQRLSALKTEVNNAQNYVNECQARVNALTNEITNNTTDQEKQKADLAVARINAETALEQAKQELEQLLKDVSGELNLDNQNDLISRQRERVAKKRQEIEKLRENAVGAVIKAPVAGIVTNISVMAGDKTEPAKELAIMQPEGKGFSLSFSVTAEQAKKVTVGEMAEIQNSWFYSDVEAVLTGIRPDPENSAEKKLLVFDVKGDVQAGQSISLSVGQKSAEYDLLVPNSAVREDNQGKFILIVEAKNSPLGNRYIAKRVDVEVLGADDLRTAIRAPVFGYEYVITTATQPVEAGKQVRLAENN